MFDLKSEYSPAGDQPQAIKEIKKDFTRQDFEQWQKEKRNIQQKTKSKKVLQGEIRIAKIGVNIGSEIGKDCPFVRPILVLQTSC